MSHPHILLVCQSVQGHLNPSMQFAKNLICAGACVTLATTVSGFPKLKSLPSIPGLSFASFTDGYDDDISAIMLPGYVQNVRSVSSESLKSLIQTLSKSGNHVTFLIYALFLPWAAVVARELHLPSALFLIQSATSFCIYNRFCNSRDGIVAINKDIETSMTLELPGLPLFKWNDFPTFVLPQSPYFPDMFSVYRDHMQSLEEDPNPCVLVNTLDGLEPDAMKLIPNSMVIGPLVPSSFSGERGQYLQWLDTKPEKSVVYVSFGSLAVLSKVQKEELLSGLVECGRPFLLVLRDSGEDEDEEIKRLKEKLGDDGLIVGWCTQLEVLRHPAIGCFVTHCGWNSTLESMAAGVAIVGCPQFSDQPTNAKMVEEVWGNGVRARADEGGIEARVVRREEIKRCLEVVMNGCDRAKDINKSVEKWKKVAVESVKDGGSSQLNLKVFLESIS